MSVAIKSCSSAANSTPVGPPPIFFGGKTLGHCHKIKRHTDDAKIEESATVVV